jgi:hypothetical protein
MQFDINDHGHPEVRICFLLSNGVDLKMLIFTRKKIIQSNILATNSLDKFFANFSVSSLNKLSKWPLSSC